MGAELSRRAVLGLAGMGTRRIGLAVAILLAVPAPAWPVESEATGENCRGVFAGFEAEPRVVREVGDIPLDWTLQGEAETGRASVFLVTLTCTGLTAGGLTAPVTYAILSASVDPPEQVANRTTSSFAGVSGETDFYLISWTTNHAGLAEWLKDGTGLKDRVHFAPNLEMNWPLGALADVRFEAKAPAPSPFEMRARVTEPALLLHPVVANFWAATAVGDVMIETSNPDGVRMGVDTWHLEAASGSEMETIMGSTKRSSSCETVVCVPGAEAQHRALYRKDVPPRKG